MVSELAEDGHNEKPSYVQLSKQLENLRENNCERETTIKVLTSDSRKTKERLKALERLAVSFRLDKLKIKMEVKGNTDHTQAVNEQFVKTFIELTCECVVINKKLKYLRRLMKLNAQKLKELEKITKPANEREDKFCQTEGKREDEEATSTCSSREFISGSSSSDADTLMSEMFYLPTHPELPDLRLFSLL